MMIVNNLRNDVLDVVIEQLINNIKQIAIGTGSAIPSELDTSLVNEVLKKNIINRIVNNNNYIQFEIWVSSVEANVSLAECGVFCDNELLFRFTYPVVNKDNTFELKFTVTINLEVLQ